MEYQSAANRYETMKYNRTGKSGLDLPAVSLGLWNNFGGIHSFMFWIGLITIGCVVPAILLFVRRTGTSVRWTVFASTLVVVGVLFERFLIVIPGLIHPPELFPGWEITGMAVEGVAVYHISYLEILQTLGVLGVIGFAFVVGLKLMPLAPTQARWSTPEEQAARSGWKPEH